MRVTSIAETPTNRDASQMTMEAMTTIARSLTVIDCASRSRWRDHATNYGSGMYVCGGCGALTWIACSGRSYRTPSHSARSTERGSSTTSDVVSKRMVALRCRSYCRPTGVSIGREGHPGGVHGVGELLRRVRSQQRLSPVAERVEDEGESPAHGTRRGVHRTAVSARQTRTYRWPGCSSRGRRPGG